MYKVKGAVCVEQGLHASTAPGLSATLDAMILQAKLIR